MPAMDCIDRAHSHRSSSTTTTDFFICFTARLSSTTRTHSSKSHMSPGRAPSLSASLSRRLRSGSIKGAQSPMFPGGRRKGCGFEAAEPSSPKVTCIGQVRVKSKKKKLAAAGAAAGANLPTRTRSQREASFRRQPEPDAEKETECLPNRNNNQSWVYQLPISICDALRSIGSEVNCFVPCKGGRSPCSSTGKTKRRTRSSSSCGAVFARWLMAIDEEREEGEVMDLVVEREKGDVGFVVREMERKEMEVIGLKEEEVVVVEEERMVSVCIPPRNALLLMRCRSDPARVAALADRFWGSPTAAKGPVLEDREEDGNAAQDHSEEDEVDEVAEPDLDSQAEAAVSSEPEPEPKPVEKQDDQGELDAVVISTIAHTEEEKMDHEEEGEAKVLVETETDPSRNVELEPVAVEEVKKDEAHEDEIAKGRRSSSCSSSSKAKEGGRRRSVSSRDKERRRHSFSSELEARRKSFTSEKDARRASFSEERRRRSFTLEKGELALKNKPAIATAEEEHVIKQVIYIDEVQSIEVISKPNVFIQETEVIPDKKKTVTAVEKPRDQLPACLLQMMYEPKLSMEVSKETWVCSDDFLRWRPHRPAAKPVPGNPNNAVSDDKDCESNKIEAALVPEDDDDLPDQPPTPVPPPRPLQQPSPPPLPPAAAVEKKVMGTTAVAVYGVPLVLTRCNSEPVRSSAKLTPDACFWKSRHQPIGAAGVGF